VFSFFPRIISLSKDNENLQIEALTRTSVIKIQILTFLLRSVYYLVEKWKDLLGIIVNIVHC
jgi:hypothetical protein